MIAAPFLTKKINVKLWHASIVQNENALLQNGNISVHLPSHHFASWSLAGGVGFNCDDDAVLRTDCSGTTIISFIQLTKDD